MKPELTACTIHVCKGRNGRQFPALEIEDVAREDIREKMLFEEGVDGWRELLPGSRRRNFLQACKRGSHLRPIFILVQIGGNRAGFLSDLVFDPIGFTLIEDRHEREDTVQAAWESGIGIHLHQDFLDLVHGQPGFETVVQRCVQLFHVPAGGERCDRDDALLFCVERRSVIHSVYL